MNGVGASKKFLCLVIVVVLLTSFFLHDAVEHDHPSWMFGSGLEAVLHNANREWWYFILLAALLFVVRLDFRQEERQPFSISVPAFSREGTDFFKLVDPVLAALRRGTLHSKLCE